MNIRKTLIWSVSALVTLCAVGWLALVLFFPAETLRNELAERASAELERPVTIGALSVSIWGGPGARVSDIQIGNPRETAESGISASVDAVDIKVQFWPLFSGEYVVDRLIVDKPEIRIQPQATKKPDASSQSGSGISTEDATGAKLALGGLSFGKLEIHDGSLERRNQADGSKVTVGGISFAGRLQRIAGKSVYQSSGRLAFDSLSFSSVGDSLPMTVPAMSLTYQVEVDTVTQRLKASAGDGHLNIEGDIALAGAKSSASHLQIAGETPLAMLLSLAPAMATAEVGGDVTLDLTLDGPLSSLEGVMINGRVGVSGGSISSAGLPEELEDFNADLVIQPGRIEIQTLKFQFSESDLSLEGAITNPFPYLLPVSQKVRENSTGPYLRFSATSRHLNIDRLFPEAAPAPEEGKNNAQAESASLPLVIPEMKGEGTVRIDTLIYAAVEFSDVRADVNIDRRRIYCQHVKGMALGGEFKGEAFIDMTRIEKPRYSGTYEASGIQARDFINRFAPWDGSGALTGAMSAKGSYATSGWEREEFLAGLSMDMLSNADSLLLTSEALSKALTATIKQVSGASVLENDYKKLNLRAVKSRIRFVDGHVQVDTLRGFSDEVGGWSLHGAIGLDGSLDIKGDLTPTQEMIAALMKKNTVAGAVAALLKTSPEGAINLPFTVTGTTEKPSLNLDKDALGKALNRTLKERGGSILKGLFQRP